MLKIDKINITQELLIDISNIETFKGKFSNLGEDSYFLELLKAQARITGTAASIRIEGSLLKDYEVERVLSGISSTTFRGKDVTEALGYAAALDYVNEQFEILELTETNLKKLHSMIVEKHDSDYRKSVKPKQNIQSDEPDVLNANVSDIPKLTIELLGKTDALLKSRSHHPILVIALFIMHFLTINPFEEGNGRLSRLLSSLLLQKSGYSFISYYSFESIIEESRKTYLYALKRSQQSYSGDVDYSSWLNYFVKTLLKVCTKLDQRIERERSKDVKTIELSPIENDIAGAIKEKGIIYTSQLIDTLEQYKAPTIKKALSEMVKMDIIELLGKGRGSYYRMKA